MSLRPICATSAAFSDCRRYRYSLTRLWVSDLPALNVIGLNPSTADETVDDPTIRRCIGYARDWGFGALVMTNLFAWRSTDPKGLLVPGDPIGPMNDDWLIDEAQNAGQVLCAWGTGGRFYNRGLTVERMLRAEGIRLWQLGETAEGYPRHPLYLRLDAVPVEMPA